MLGISTKGQSMPPSPIRKLVPFAEKAKAQGKTVYHLNIGQPDIATPDIAIEAIKKMDLKVIEYSHSAGFESYRKGLEKYYKSHDINVNYEDMIITTGASEALVFAFQTCLNPGDELIIPEPFYANYNGFAVIAGVKIVPVTSHIEDGFSLPPISAFEEKITDKTKGILICNPGNPTGSVYSKSDLQKLKELVLEKDLYLFADEVYREFCYDDNLPFSVMNMEGAENNTIMIDSVSKRYSVCGVRVGALISKNKMVMETAMKFAQARLSPPTLGQIAGEAALDTDDTYFITVINEYIQRRNILVNGLNKIEGVECPLPKGAFYCVAKLPVDDTEKFCQWLLEDFEYNGQTVMMAPASGFYATPGLGKQEVRIAYVLEKKHLENAVKCIEVALKQYPGTTR